MAVLVVQRPVADRAGGVVHRRPVLAQALDAGPAALEIEPAARQDRAHRVDPVLDAVARHDREAEPEAPRLFLPGPPGAELAGERVRRRVVAAIDIAALGGPRLEQPRIVVEPLAGRLVVVQQMDLRPGELGEPDRRRIADAEVPGGIDRQIGIVRDAADAPGPLRLGHRPAVIGAPDRRLEGAFEFLVVFLLRHVAPRGIELGRRQDVGVGCREQRRVPALVRAGRAVFAPELVMALGRADEDRPAFAVGERRADHLAPEMRAHLRVFVEHHPVEIDAAQRIRVVGAVELDPRAVGEVDAELGLARRPVRHRRRVVLEIVPRDLLGLAVERRDIGVARALAPRADRVVDELVDAEHRLAEAAVADQHAEALEPAVDIGL